jgi:hypothetical protein
MTELLQFPTQHRGARNPVAEVCYHITVVIYHTRVEAKFRQVSESFRLGMCSPSPNYLGSWWWDADEQVLIVSNTNLLSNVHTIQMTSLITSLIKHLPLDQGKLQEISKVMYCRWNPGILYPKRHVDICKDKETLPDITGVSAMAVTNYNLRYLK